jgi:hypothetical protein
LNGARFQFVDASNDIQKRGFIRDNARFQYCGVFF